MLKKMLLRMQKLEQDKQKKIEEQAKIQKKISEIDNRLKKMNTWKKDYEKIIGEGKEILEQK